MMMTIILTTMIIVRKKLPPPKIINCADFNFYGSLAEVQRTTTMMKHCMKIGHGLETH